MMTTNKPRLLSIIPEFIKGIAENFPEEGQIVHLQFGEVSAAARN
jgi:hypothetical protein